MTTQTSRPAYEPQWYSSPIHLAERRVGTAEIRHRILPVGKTVEIVGARQALLRGVKQVRGVVEGQPLRIHELLEHTKRGKDSLGRLWMTDLPEELNQIAEMVHTVAPCGRVLIGGLGLGLVASAVASCPGVEHIMVVERSPDIITLCNQGEAWGYVVAQADIADYLRESRTRYDYYLLDTWGGTNEGAWWDTVMPLRRIIRNRWGAKPVIHCWAEDIMVGQIIPALTVGKPFWYYKHLPRMTRRQAEVFTRNVGMPAWERKYGAAVDRAIADMRRDDLEQHRSRKRRTKVSRAAEA